MNESELIKKIKAGDIEAFSEFVDAYEKKAINFALRMLKDEHEAQDATQDAFLKAYDKIHSFRQSSSFSTWFFTILNNVCLDILRKRKRADIVSINKTNSETDEYEIQIEDTSPGPYESLEKKSAIKVLEDALSKISDEHRAIIILRDINGLEYEEISKILNISLGTVKSRLSRARISLRKVLESNKELFL